MVESKALIAPYVCVPLVLIPADRAHPSALLTKVELRRYPTARFSVKIRANKLKKVGNKVGGSKGDIYAWTFIFLEISTDSRKS